LVSVREEQRLNAFDSTAPRNIASRIQKVTGHWKELHNDELQ
jgi:hypothetical protein